MARNSSRRTGPRGTRSRPIKALSSRRNSRKRRTKLSNKVKPLSRLSRARTVNPPLADSRKLATRPRNRPRPVLSRNRRLRPKAKRNSRISLGSRNKGRMLRANHKRSNRMRKASSHSNKVSRRRRHSSRGRAPKAKRPNRPRGSKGLLKVSRLKDSHRASPKPGDSARTAGPSCRRAVNARTAGGSRQV